MPSSHLINAESLEIIPNQAPCDESGAEHRGNCVWSDIFENRVFGIDRGPLCCGPRHVIGLATYHPSAILLCNTEEARASRHRQCHDDGPFHGQLSETVLHKTYPIENVCEDEVHAGTAACDVPTATQQLECQNRHVGCRRRYRCCCCCCCCPCDWMPPQSNAPRVGGLFVAHLSSRGSG